MPESAISGLVHGFMQGHALREQQRQDHYEKERQHALDEAAKQQQVFQNTMSQQAAELAKQNADMRQKENVYQHEQDGIHNKLATDKEAREAKGLDGKLSLGMSRILFGMDKAKMAFVEKLFGEGIPLEDAISRVAAYSPPGPGGVPGAAPPGAGAPAGAPTASGLPSGLISGLGGMQTPAGAPPAPAIGVSPLAQSKLDKNAAQIKQIDAAGAEHLVRSAWLKQKTLNEQQNAEVIKQKGKLTHAQAVRTEYMTKIDGNYKVAETLLAEARFTEATARVGLMHAQEAHMKANDALKASSNDLTTEIKKASFRKNALSQEGKIATDRRKAEDAMGKLEAVLTSISVVAEMDETKVKPSETALLAQIRMAKKQVPYLRTRIAEMKDRVDAFTKDEKEAHEYSTSVTNYINKDGSPNKPATEKERAAARKAAQAPPKLPFIPGPGQSAPGVRTEKLHAHGADLRSASVEELFQRLAKRAKEHK